MITSEQVIEYLIMIDLQKKGAEDKLNSEGVSTLLDLQSDKKLKEVKIVDVLDYIHAQEEEIKELKDSVEYWKNEVFKKMEVKLTGVTKEKIQEIRKQVCDMARKKIIEATCYDTEEEVRNVIYDLNASEVLEILDQIEGNANGK